MSWFNDVQSGVYNLVGMIDPSDPGYQGMLKAKYMENHAKAQQETIEASRINRAPKTLALTGNSPVAYNKNSALAQLAATVDSGVSANEYSKQNPLAFLLGGSSPADLAVGSLNPAQMAQYSPIATKIQQSPQELASNALAKEQIDKGMYGLKLQDKWHENTLGLQTKELFERIRQHNQNYGVNKQNADTHRLTALAGLQGGQFGPDDAKKAQSELISALTKIQEVTGKMGSTMNVDDAITHASNQALQWAVPMAKLINSGHMSMEEGVNHVIAAILNGQPSSPDLEEKVRKVVLGTIGGGQKNLDSSTVDPKLQGTVPEMQTLAQSFASIIQQGLGIAPVFTSGFRNPEHNAEVGGVPNSLHPLGRAVDLVIPGLPPEQEIMITEMARRMGFKQAFFHGDGDNHHLHMEV